MTTWTFGNRQTERQMDVGTDELMNGQIDRRIKKLAGPINNEETDGHSAV